MQVKHGVVVWVALAAVTAVPVTLAIGSPLLQWREPVYIAAGFAGIVAMALLVFQPLLAAGALPGASALIGRRLHRYIGSALVLAVVLHVAGLWITSPPDVIDALLYRSATPFSTWGVTAMWGVFATAMLAVSRKKYHISPRVWRTVHKALAVVIVAGSVVHAVLIDGTMETISKNVLCLMVSIITFVVISGKGLKKMHSLTNPPTRADNQ